MDWLVDGMNLMGSRPDGWWKDRAGARSRLVAELAGFARSDTGAMAVVFDGHGRPGEIEAAAQAGVELSFAPGGPDAADRVIAARAGQLPRPATTTVVTSDAALAEAVRAAGVAVMGVSAFRRRLDGAG